MDSDALRSIRNSFYLGFYTACMNDAKTLIQSNSSPESNKWAQIFYHRAQAAIKPSDAIFAIPSSSPASLLAIRLYAMYSTSQDTNAKSLVNDELQELVNSDMTRDDRMVQIIWTQMCIQEKNYKEALKAVVNDNENLEKMSLCTSLYLLIDRVDLASRVVKSMSELDDDDTLTTLAQAAINLRNGGTGVNDALSGFQELIDKFGPSVLVLNSLATCEMHLKNWPSAFNYLKQARELSVSSGLVIPSATLLNGMICLQQLRKPSEIVAKIEADLKEYYPNHEYFTKKAQQNDAFTKYIQTYKFKP